MTEPEKLYHTIMSIRETYVLAKDETIEEVELELRALLGVFESVKKSNPSPHYSESVVYYKDIEKIINGAIDINNERR